MDDQRRSSYSSPRPSNSSTSSPLFDDCNVALPNGRGKQRELEEDSMAATAPPPSSSTSKQLFSSSTSAPSPTSILSARAPAAAGHGAGLRGLDEEAALEESSSDDSDHAMHDEDATANDEEVQKSNSCRSSNVSATQVSISDSNTSSTGNDYAAALAATDPNPIPLIQSLSHLVASEPGLMPPGPSTPLVPPTNRKLCVRHQRMADEGTTAKLQKSIESLTLADQTAVNTVWSLFSSSSHPRRALILQGLLTMCCFSQLSLLSTQLSLAIRIDPFTILPREISLRVLGHLDAISLGRAAQVSRLWRRLSDDDLLWRNMCEQHIERKCEKCGWGLPLLSERHRRQKVVQPRPKRPLTVDTDKARKHASKAKVAVATPSGTIKRNVTAAANAAARERNIRSSIGSRSSSPAGSNASGSLAGTSRFSEDDLEGLELDENGRPAKRQCNDATREQSSEPTPSTAHSLAHQLLVEPAPSPQLPPSAALTRPWKLVYCERLAIERNWRRGRHTITTLSGHKDGIMCLQFSDSLAHPAFPVCITGSYDRTARVWNLETGEELRVLKGHTRGVRCLQFDEAKLITGSMDRTLKIWNWRTGELIRTLEGHTEGIVCLDFNKDTLASGSADSNIKVWNFRTGQCYTLKGHKDWVNDLTLWTGPGHAHGASSSPKVSHAAGPGHSYGGAARWTDEADNVNEPPASEEDSAARTFLFSASDDGTIRLWDLALRECLLVYDGHVGQVQSIKLVMLDEEAVRKLATGAAGGPGADDADSDRLRAKHTAELSAAAQSGTPSLTPFGAPTPGASSYFSSSAGAAGLPERFYEQDSQSSSNARSQSSIPRRRRKVDPVLQRVQDRLCQAGLVPPIPLDAEMGDIDAGILPGVSGGVPGEEDDGADVDMDASARSVPSTSTPSGGRPAKRPVLISGSLDNTIKVWDVRTARCLRTLFGHVEGVWALDVDKLRIASASHDRTIKIWDRETALCQNTLVGHRGAVTCVALGDDKIVSGSDDGDVRVWSFAAPQTDTTMAAAAAAGGSKVMP